MKILYFSKLIFIVEIPYYLYLVDIYDTKIQIIYETECSYWENMLSCITFNYRLIQLSEVKEEVKKEVNSLRSWKLYATHRTIAFASPLYRPARSA